MGFLGFVRKIPFFLSLFKPFVDPLLPTPLGLIFHFYFLGYVYLQFLFFFIYCYYFFCSLFVTVHVLLSVLYLYFYLFFRYPYLFFYLFLRGCRDFGQFLPFILHMREICYLNDLCLFRIPVNLEVFMDQGNDFNFLLNLNCCYLVCSAMNDKQITHIN